MGRKGDWRPGNPGKPGTPSGRTRPSPAGRNGDMGRSLRSLACRHEALSTGHKHYHLTVSPKGLILFMIASCSGVTLAPEAALVPGLAPGNMERLGFML